MKSENHRAAARAKWDKKRRCLDCSRRIIHSETARYCSTCALKRIRAKNRESQARYKAGGFGPRETVAHVERLLELVEKQNARPKWQGAR